MDELDAVQLLLAGDKFGALRAGEQQVDRGINAHARRRRVQHQLHIRRALQVFRDGVIHAAARFDVHDGENRQRTAFTQTARRAEELLRLLQAYRIHHADGLPPLLNSRGCVNLGEVSQAVHQQNHVFLHFHQPLGALQHHVGDAQMIFRRLIEGGGNHLAVRVVTVERRVLGRAAQQQRHHHRIRMADAGCVGNGGQQMRLVHGRRAVNQRALTKANRRNEVNQAHVKELIAAAFHFEGDVLVRIAGRQGVKRGAVRHRISGAAVDLGDVEHGGVLVAVALGTHLAGYEVARAEIEAANLRHRDVNIAIAGGERRAAQEAVAVRVQLQNARTILTFRRGEHVARRTRPHALQV